MAEGKGHTELPSRVWLRVCGGGITMPSGKPYTTLVGDDKPMDRHVEFVRGDIANQLADSLEAIRKMLWARPDISDKLRPLMGFAEQRLSDDAQSALSRFRSLQNGGES